MQLGIAYLHEGNLALAKEKLDKAVKQNPNNAEVHSVRALLYERLDSPTRPTPSTGPRCAWRPMTRTSSTTTRSTCARTGAPMRA